MKWGLHAAPHVQLGRQCKYAVHGIYQYWVQENNGRLMSMCMRSSWPRGSVRRGLASSELHHTVSNPLEMSLVFDTRERRRHGTTFSHQTRCDHSISSNGGISDSSTTADWTSYPYTLLKMELSAAQSWSGRQTRYGRVSRAPRLQTAPKVNNRRLRTRRTGAYASPERSAEDRLGAESAPDSFLRTWSAPLSHTCNQTPLNKWSFCESFFGSGGKNTGRGKVTSHPSNPRCDSPPPMRDPSPLI